MVIRGLKIFYFDFDWPKGSDENFKHKIEFVIKSIEPVAENKKKRDWTIIIQIQACKQYL